MANDSEDAAYIGGKLLIIAAFAVGAILLGSITLRRRTSQSRGHDVRDARPARHRPVAGQRQPGSQ